MSLPPISSPPIEQSPCRLCGRQFAKYNCPTCGVAYCSLVCFRSEAHSQCSETFYKKEVEQSIQSEPSKTPQERMKMMEMLRKFEKESQESIADEIDSDEGENDDDLVQRFQDVDLDSASVADIWSKLTSAEREQFAKALNDPSSDLALQLLASEDLETQRREPWWDALMEDVLEGSSKKKRYGTRPEAIHVPSTLITPLPNGPPLYYNTCAVCIAYAFITRHLSVSPLSSLRPNDLDFDEAMRLLAQLVPFLLDRKSTTLFSQLSSLITDIWSRFKPGQINNGLLALLLRDASNLIRPFAVTMIPTTLSSSEEGNRELNFHPHAKLVLVLSDLVKMYEMAKAGRKPNHISHKLLFYAAHILSTPTPILRTLSEELFEASAAYAAKSVDDRGHQVSDVSGPRSEPGAHHKGPMARKAIIEEV